MMSNNEDDEAAFEECSRWMRKIVWVRRCGMGSERNGKTRRNENASLAY
jgi:hypothetical protein